LKTNKFLHPAGMPSLRDFPLSGNSFPQGIPSFMDFPSPVKLMLHIIASIGYIKGANY